MNFSRVNNFSGFISRIVPSKISARLGFERKKEKDEEEGVEEAATSQQDEESSVGGAGCVALFDEASTAVQRRGRKEKVEDAEQRLGEVIIPQHPRASSSASLFTVATEVLPTVGQGAKRESIESSSSSDSSSIEEALRKAIGSKDLDEFADAFANRSKPSESQNIQEEESANQGRRDEQQPEQRNEEEVGELVAQNQAEEGEDEFELQNLPNPAASTPHSPNGAGDHLSIELGAAVAGDNSENLNPTYVESYLGLMYKVGLSPFLPEGASPGIWGCCQIACFVQVVLYWGFTIAAILEAFGVGKYAFFQFISDGGDLEDFTDTCFFIMNVFLNLYSAYLFTMQQHRFAKMIQSMSRLRAFAAKYSKVEEEKYRPILVLFLATASFVISVLSVVFEIGLIGWTPEKGVLFNSYRASTAIFIWTGEPFKNDTAGLKVLNKQYGTDATTAKIIVGLIYGGMRLCNRVIANANSDLILATGATIKNQMFRLAREVGNPEYDIDPVTLEEFEKEGGQWEHYQLLQEAVDDTNDTFESLLKYLHVQNIMLFVYIVMNAFDGFMKFVTILYFVYNIIKASCTYRIATLAAEKNETFLDWIRRLIWKCSDQRFTNQLNVILDKMKTRRLGLGTGQFLIDESFMFRFLGTVGSVFVLQAQNREASNQNSR